MFCIGIPLTLGHFDKAVVIRALGPFGFNVGFATSDHVGRDSFVKAIDVAISLGMPSFIQVVEIPLLRRLRAWAVLAL